MVMKMSRVIFFLLVFVQSTSFALTSSQMAALKAFFANDVVLDKKTLDNAPYVLALAEEHVLAAAPMDRVYVRGKDIFIKNQHYALYRRGDAYRDPMTKKIIGYEGKYVGEGIILENGDPAVLGLEEGTQEIKPGDRLVPRDLAKLDTHFQVHRPKNKIKGQVVAVRNGIKGYGMYHVVIINRGERQGIHLGDALGIYKRGTPMRDPYAKGEKVITPRDYEGKMFIFKCFDHMSIGLVVDAKLPMTVSDEVANL